MFEDVATDDLLSTLSGFDFAAVTGEDFGASRIDAIIASERVIRAAQAVQLGQIAAPYAERCEQIPLGSGDASLSVIGEVGLARTISPSAAGNQFGVAITLDRLPRVTAALADGAISEPTARAICREVTPLSIDHMPLFDHEITPHLQGLTPGRAARLARDIVISLDAEAAATRAEVNRADQRVTLHPEPDGIATLIVRGPAEQLVAAHQALETWARGLRSTGDDRSVGQIMTATLVERVTGLAHPDHLDVELQVVMPVETLTGNGEAPADLVGYGPIAPDLAERIIGQAHHAWIRRLFTDPINDTLIARDPRRRRFDGHLAGYLRSRDRNRCRQPGCECRVRDIDHIRPYATGGMTTADNAQSLCRRSHTLKHLPGWKITTGPNGSIIWNTPTGHTYTSKQPKYHRRT